MEFPFQPRRRPYCRHVGGSVPSVRTRRTVPVSQSLHCWPSVHYHARYRNNSRPVRGKFLGTESSASCLYNWHLMSVGSRLHRLDTTRTRDWQCSSTVMGDADSLSYWTDRFDFQPFPKARHMLTCHQRPSHGSRQR